VSPGLGIDVGGTKILAVVADDAGRIVAERRVPTPTGFAPLVDALAQIASELMLEEPAPQGAGIGIAGMVDLAGTVVYSPNLPGLRDAAIGEALAARLGVPVRVDNDANLAALAEATRGGGVGYEQVLAITFGTGVGGGLVVGGEVMRGAHGFFGEVGHFVVDRDGPMCACGHRGHWEAIASGTALGAMARTLVSSGRGAGIAAAAGGDEVAGEHVGVAAAAGDRDALELLERYAANVAVGLASLCNILDPDAVVIGGGVADLGELLMEPLRVAFDAELEGVDHRPDIALRFAALGGQATAIGAAILAGAPR
jgi:glucokinase